jgi:hypothetical protein
MEGPKPRNLETDIGAAEEARHVGLAEEISRRMAVGAAPERDQIFSALDLLALPDCGAAAAASGRLPAASSNDMSWTACQPATPLASVEDPEPSFAALSRK